MSEHEQADDATSQEATETPWFEDLGVAYKEMGLTSESIAHLAAALRGGHDPVATAEVLGEILVAAGWSDAGADNARHSLAVAAAERPGRVGDHSLRDPGPRPHPGRRLMTRGIFLLASPFAALLGSCAAVPAGPVASMECGVTGSSAPDSSSVRRDGRNGARVTVMPGSDHIR